MVKSAEGSLIFLNLTRVTEERTNLRPVLLTVLMFS